MDGGPSQVDTFDPKPRLDARARRADQDAGTRRRSSSRTTAPPKVLRLAVEVPAHTASAARRSASCFRTSPTASTTCASSARWSPTSPSTPTPICSCTPASTSRAGPASAPGSPTAWAASARTCPATSCSTAASFPPAAPTISTAAFCRPSIKARSFAMPQAPVANLQRGEAERRAAAGQARPAAQARSLGARPAGPRRPRRSGHRQLRAGLPHAGRRAGAARHRAAKPPPRRGCTASTTRRPGPSACSACWPAGWSSAACASSS